MECLFFGESEKAYFNYEDIDKQRRIPKALYPKNDYDLIKDKKFKYIPKESGELRLVSCDIAGMEGKENDASVYTIIRLIPTKTGYNRDISYMESIEGGHTGDQANRIRQMYYDFDCDYVVLDTQNMGLGVFDSLTQPTFDPDRNVEYPAWTCINDEKMAARCSYQNAEERIFSVKGNQTFNSECAVLLKDGIRRGKVRLLSRENEAKEYFRKHKGFDELTPETRAYFEHPFKQITALINEMINLEGERTDSGLVKLKEPRSKRKDRYSSVSYGNFIASQLERDLLKETIVDDPDDDIILF
ncbi:hypothetical protein [Halobacillus litoralis]|uniref:hypothetical protein n=1 Tax=Halobacillus litoralis TaxID=45668 RepID=UPI001CD43762|nr:hypothetical protein [Halobacillus litoralis]MCA1021636.1 hypothetical protein [Halobacillus litoralis]